MGLLQRFRKDQSGATAALFGLTLIPLAGFAGAAIDYSRASSGRAHLQKAADGAALALARHAGALTEDQLKTRGEDLVKTYLKTATGVRTESIAVKRGDKTIRVAVTGSVKTAIMGLAGFETIAIGSDAEVAWGSKKIELALVLDNTGSMNDWVKGKRKLDELKKASYGLLDELKNAAVEADAVKVAIVPFDTQVRVDASAHRFAPWLGIDPSDRYNWHGYIEDRGDAKHKTAFDTTDDPAAKKDTESMYPAVLGKRGVELAPIQPLVSAAAGHDKLRDTVKAMQGVGFTNITIGAAWGMAVLSKAEPFTEAADPSTKLEKIIVIVTDGDNTRNRFTSTSAKIDQRTALACQAAKDKGIRVVTIRLIEGNAKLLKACASLVTDPQDPFYRRGEPLYYDVQDPTDLANAFGKIKDMILGTRLTH